MDNILFIKFAVGFISSAVLAGIGYLFARLMARARPAEVGEHFGRIRTSLWPPMIQAAFFFGTGCLMLYFTHFAHLAGVAIGLLFCLLGLVCLSFILPVHDIRWDENGLSGPSSWVPWPIGPFPIYITYQEIVSVGQDLNGCWYVQNTAGRRIKWNHYYVSYPALADAILKARPDLY